MSANPHRTSWVGRPGEKGRTCQACGTHATNVRAQQVHADVFEPGVKLPTTGVLLDEDGDR